MAPSWRRSAQARSVLGPDGLVAAGEVGTALSLVGFGLAHGPLLAMAASVLAGACWIGVVANLNISAQVALPNWVRGRGLALYVTVFFGSMTLGSAAWGALANATDLRTALLAAAAGALLAAGLTWQWKLQTGATLDLTPSMHWPEPVVTTAVEDDEGPVMVTLEYQLLPGHREAFLTALGRQSGERRRDGAYAWGVFEDIAHEERFIETFLVDSWNEHLRQHRRVTKADRALEETMRQHVLICPSSGISSPPGRAKNWAKRAEEVPDAEAAPYPQVGAVRPGVRRKRRPTH
jgi:hypothetical protein